MKAEMNRALSVSDRSEKFLSPAIATSVSSRLLAMVVYHDA
jgi:hypothetical protein